MKRAAVVVLSSYPADVRVRREAESLVDAGFKVDLICYNKSDLPKQETINGVNVFRLKMQRKRASKLRYFWEYISFTTRALFKLSHLHLQNRYDLIHVHNMPDILVFSALLPRLLGAKIMLDLHDPTPEVFIAKYGIHPNHPIIKILKWLEKISIRFAHQVITPNKAFQDVFISRGCPRQKIDIVMNTPMEHIFNSNSTNENSRSKANNRKFVVMFHGTIVKRHGILTALKAMAKLRPQIPGLAFDVYGNGDFTEDFLKQVKQLNLEDIVRYHGFVTNETIAAAIPQIDLGIIPNEVNAFTRLNLPVRIFEYLSLHKPVIVPQTRGIRDYFSPDTLNFFEGDDSDNLAEAILTIYRHPEQQKEIINRGYKIYQQYRWESQKKHFCGIAEKLIEDDVLKTSSFSLSPEQGM